MSIDYIRCMITSTTAYVVNNEVAADDLWAAIRITGTDADSRSVSRVLRYGDGTYAGLAALTANERLGFHALAEATASGRAAIHVTANLRAAGVPADIAYNLVYEGREA